MDNVIIGTGYGYTPEQMNIFVKSWRKYCNNTRLIMIMSPNTNNETIHWLSAHGVETRMFAGGLYTPASINYSRYFKYFDLLCENHGNFKNVFLTDVRDVAFQGNIFDSITESGLHCFIEDRRHTIATQAFNNIAMTIQYGKEVSQQLGHLPIICSGTTLGDYHSILEYVSLILNERNLEQIVRDHLFDVVCDGIDQAMHMYILHKDMIKNVKHENGDGVSTMAIMKPENISILSNTKVAIYKDKVAPVIHQWDRHPEIENHLKRIYQ
jgi:hypothetical protein